MKTLKITITILAIAFRSQGQFNLGNATQDVNNLKNNSTVQKLTGNKGSSGLSDQDIANGLKDALRVGSNNAGSSASKTDGFYKNQLITIPFPPDAQKVENTANDLGMQQQVNDFVVSLNRAAEKAAQKAAPIFINAIMSMTIQDGMSILKGNNDAATQYLKSKTSQQLHDAFIPIVKHAIDSVQVTKYWTPLANAYNSIPLVTPVNPDLNEYVIQKGLSGLFILLAQEELKIRQNPAARVTDILKKVFGSLDNK